MTNYNPENERIKRGYFRFQKEAKRKSEGTVDGIRKAVLRFENYTGFKSFRTFHKDQIIAFKEHLSHTKAERTGEPLSKSTMLSTVNALKDFFGWLSFQTGFKNRINRLDIEYFNLSEKDTRTAKAGKFREFPTLEQIRKVIFSMPTKTDIDRRNRALVAFTILTGVRDSAIASLRLKHIDLERDLVRQEPDQVKTKFGKRIDTFFFPIGDDIKAVFVEWVRELKEQKLYGLNDPVFPKTKQVFDLNRSFKAEGLEPKGWATASPIREVFKEAFRRVDIPYFSPHTFRHTLGHIGEKVCKTPEEFKSWSQNLGHEHVMTTFNSYGNISPHRQGEVIRELAESGDREDKLDLILKHVKDSQKPR
jgi:integrase